MRLFLRFYPHTLLRRVRGPYNQIGSTNCQRRSAHYWRSFGQSTTPCMTGSNYLSHYMIFGRSLIVLTFIVECVFSLQPWRNPWYVQLHQRARSISGLTQALDQHNNRIQIYGSLYGHLIWTFSSHYILRAFEIVDYGLLAVYQCRAFARCLYIPKHSSGTSSLLSILI